MKKLELLVTRESDINGLEVCLKPNIPYVITPGLVQEIRILQDRIVNELISKNNNEYFYVIWYMDNKQRYQWRGLDYRYIVECMDNNKKKEVESYIDGVFRIIFLNYIGFGLPVINCSIVDRFTCGVSTEFFLLNRICFLFDKKVTDIQKIQIKRKKVFPDQMYEQNHYYAFPKLDFHKMRKIVEDVTINSAMDIMDFEEIEKQFEMAKQKTLDIIFENTEKKNKKLHLLSVLQAKAQRC